MKTYVAVWGPVEPWITGLLSWRAGDWLKCVLGVWENACGCWGLLCPGLGGHGLNAFWEAVKKQVAGLGPWSLGLLQVCFRGALGMA